MSNPVRLSALRPGQHFTLDGTDGQVVEQLPEAVKVYLRQKRGAKWVWVETEWSKHQRVVRDG